MAGEHRVRTSGRERLERFGEGVNPLLTLVRPNCIICREVPPIPLGRSRRESPAPPAGFSPRVGLCTSGRRSLARLPVVSKAVAKMVRLNNALVQAADELRAGLLQHRRAITKVTSLVSSGIPGLDALAAVDAEEARRELSDLLARFETARRRARQAIIALCVEEGTTTSEVARRFGISRQLASRLRSEAERDESEPKRVGSTSRPPRASRR